MISEKMFQKKLAKMQRRGERQRAKYELESQYAEYYPHKNGTKVSNVMLVVVVTMILAYTMASFVLQFYTSVEISSTLTTCFFSFWGAEVLALAGIKISKRRKEHVDENNEEDNG